ncbi:MAG: glycoside hydrolase family 3 protein [Aestuariibacter sp.]|uniref:glycoside hydrolase family 3 protein n=1 Tax=Marisediminitalea aggregata TaxID=634436 RepID=UPI0020CDD712|nr:glycoside hydrolase family 3 protein [Marisediminitalea aggregata]MCP4529502.1 glycoside hydrolase family 3 protein [Aestuariibacter sp.]MCP4946809.1 glycoside hydrolase family 3 protein [Aestuariibacter sp.]MCP9477012.1 glycoside hydrolase family 3 protein [Marisediminitalea aggregata]
MNIETAIRKTGMMLRGFYGVLGVLAMLSVTASCSSSSESTLWLGQKLMLDLRYYCEDGTDEKHCKTPVTALSPELEAVIREGKIGGVILFAENLEETGQVVRLNYQLQTIAKEAGLPPLFVAIDQEGGRVARLPDAVATRFVGNMAIGATYPTHGTAFSTSVNAGIAKSIRLLGFNVNFAPTVDVNLNADNPVINVRSYSESPEQVAEMGAAAVSALQQHGVMSALKHFPGHGDTHVDSHTGLPKVEHDAATINAVDLLPFKHAIEQADYPAMIMTAHIQYPALDDTTFITRDGEQKVLPATLSKKILTGLLRDDMGYNGLIVTDALDMAGIAQYVDHRDAVIKTFNAGADIALMPFAIRNPEGIKQFRALYKQWIQAREHGELNAAEMDASLQRILEAKQAYKLGDFIARPLTQRLEEATAALPMADNQQLERELAEAALTKVFDKGVLPLKGKHFALVMPDEARCDALSNALKQYGKGITTVCMSLNRIATQPDLSPLLSADALIIGDITPQHSMAEMGGMDDLASWRARPDKAAIDRWVKSLTEQAKANQVKTVMVALRTPYMLSEYRNVVDAGVATFGYNVTISQTPKSEVAEGAVFSALAAGLLGHIPMPGQSPVTIE